MRKLHASIMVLALLSLTVAARADHARPGLFSDVGAPPTVEDAAHGNTSTALMIDRCNAFLKSSRFDKEGHITDYKHDYKAGFCLGWINSAMVFMNVRDKDGHQALGVCLPDAIHTKSVVETFLAFAKEHIDDHKFNPTFLIYWSLLDKYPCKG